MAATTLDLLRHGEPLGGRRYRGAIDDPLSERGWQQMRDATAMPAAWQGIISSPLTRCAAFATELADRLELPLSIDPRLQEVGFGSWEGQTGEQLRATDPQILQRFFATPTVGACTEAAPYTLLRICASLKCTAYVVFRNRPANTHVQSKLLSVLWCREGVLIN